MRRVWGCTPASSAATEITYSPFLVPSATSDSQVRSRGFLGRLGQRLHSLALLGRELGRDGDLGGDEQVTGALADGHAAALDPEGAARTRPRGDAQRDGPSVEGRHLDLGTQRRLGEGDGHGEEQVPSLAVEQLVGRDMDDDIEVAGRAAIPSCAATTLQTNALAVVDPSRDAHLDLARSALDARASACRARRLDDGASARAARTRPAERERALVVFDRTAATALRADDGRRARSRAAAATGVTCHLAGEVD